MAAISRPLFAFAALFALPGCAAVASLDRAADRAQYRSNCHTSTGEWVGGPSCTIEWSSSETVSTTTTTTVVTTTPAPAPAEPRDH